MATFSDKIRLLFEVDDKGSFGKLKKDIAQAETATGKAKAGFKGLGDTLKANAAGAAVAAGSALVAFGAKAVTAFTDSALAASKFADATGLAVEDASRWIEVAGDLGIEAGTIQGAFQKLNKSIADGKPALEQYGVEIVKTKDGVVDANATFINAATTIGKIEDPTKRAKAAQEVFGKSYGEVAELMEMDAKSLQSALASVSDEQVIDADEVRKAKAFREAMDNLQDAFIRLQMAIGEELTPTITEAAEGIQEIIDSPLIEWLGKASRAIDKVTIDIADVATGFRVAGEAIDIVLGKDVPGALDPWEKGTIEVAEATETLSADLADLDKKTTTAERSTRKLETAYKSLTDALSAEEAWIGVEEAIDTYTEKVNEAGASNRDKRLALVQLKQELIAYLGELEGVPVEKQTEILALIDQGAFDEAEKALGYLSRQRSVAISPTTGGQLPTVPRFDSGGVMPGPRGEHNLALVAGGETILPTHKGPVSVAGGGDTYVFNQIGMTTDQLVRLVEQAKRKHGRGFLS